jgi:hypothetical protein
MMDKGEKNESAEQKIWHPRFYIGTPWSATINRYENQLTDKNNSPCTFSREPGTRESLSRKFKKEKL